jgi:C4-dicarboxylate transporter DctQ subunit
VERACELGAGVALWGIVIVLFFQMFFRYVLRTGLAWPDELARYLHIVVVFLMLGAVARHGQHVRVGVLADRLRGTALPRLVSALELVTAAVIAGGALEIVRRLGAFRTPALAMPLALFFLPAAAGFTLMAIETVRGRASGGSTAPGAPEPPSDAR